MIEPLTTQTFKILCSQWVDIINRCESGIQMWAPITGAHIRIKQFLADTDLQKRLFPDSPHFLFIDANEIADFSFADFEKKVLEELANSKVNSLDAYLKIHQQKLVIFFTGLDTALKNGNSDILKQLGGLLQKHTNFSLLLFVEFDVLNEVVIQSVAVKSPFLQNIFYAKLYTYEDCLQFYSYLEEKWQCTFEQEKTAALAKKIGGNFWLIKESARILRANPSYTVEQILQTSILIKKGVTIYNFLDKRDQKSVIGILNDRKQTISDYLQQTEIIQKDTLGICYWYEIKNYLTKKNDLVESFASSTNVGIYFTAVEREIFELLLDSNRIVTREEIAKSLWSEAWEERYSDWAIDQLMHRLREKMLLFKAPYQIITKKGEGFIITTK